MSTDHISLPLAEEATCNGERREWESQECRDFQAVVLSSNPSCPEEGAILLTSNHDQDAALNEQVVSQLLPGQGTAKYANPDDTERPPLLEQDDHHSEQGQDIGNAEDQSAQDDSVNEESPIVLEWHSPLLQQENTVAPILNGSSKQPTTRVLRNSQSQIRLFQHGGPLGQAHMAESKTMEDGLNGTQKSSMSLTQENPESAYEGYNLQRLIYAQTSINDSSDGRAEIHDANLLPRTYQNHQSLVTDSTAHTYGESDTGHIQFDLSQLREESQEQEEQMSQDPSNVPARFSGRSSYEPKTPAPAVNPFQQKGSVMKQQDLFGATQASSAVRAVLRSPTSSRPSPDVFNQFMTPGLPSSPLQRGGVAHPSSQSPHELPNSLINGLSVPSNSSQPFHTPGPVDPQRTLQPRAYRSTKQSQERRRIQQDSDTESDSSGSDSSIDAVARYNKKARLDERIHRELSAVGFRRPTSSRPLSSPSTAAMVEVPSTSSRRRRSFQEDSPPQCDGLDIPNTQQDDIVADSQKMPSNDPNPKVETVSLSQLTESSNQPQPKPSDHSHPSPKRPRSPQDNALIYELPSNQNMPPLAANEHKSQSANNLDDDTIPETSPIRRNRIRPMRDIASFSYSAEDDIMEELPGFSQDLDFERALGRMPAPSPRTLLRNDTEASHFLKSALKSTKGSIPGQMTEPLPRISRKSVEASKSAKLAFESPPRQNSCETTKTPEASIKSPSRSPGCASKIGNASTPERKNSLQGKLLDVELSTLKKATEADVPTTRHEMSKQFDGPLPKPQTPEPSIEPMSSALSSVPSFETNDEMSPTTQIDGQSDTENHILLGTPLPDDEKLLLLSESNPEDPQRAKGSPAASARKASRQARRATKLQSPGEDELSHAALLQVQKTNQKTKEPITTRSGRRPLSAAALGEHSLSSTQKKRASNRKSGPIATVNSEMLPPTRSSKRVSAAHLSRESSDDPITLDLQSTSTTKMKSGKGMFNGMAFAVSYVASESDKNETIKLILENGGQILEQGFDSLFNIGTSNASTDLTELRLVPTAENIGFTALVADKHSRKAKYMQALALGLPCLSGKWISACVSKCSLVDWSPYLLCAGQSPILEDAYRSRTLRPYSAADAKLIDTLESRDRLLAGKSILLVTGKGKRSEARNAYVFLARALGPARIGQAVDMAEARKMLVGAAKEGADWDLICVDKAEKGDGATLFDSSTSAGGGSRKRKRASSVTLEDSPALKRVRVINNESVIQSLILGQLMDD